jgi:hypothetical protein
MLVANMTAHAVMQFILTRVAPCQETKGTVSSSGKLAKLCRGSTQETLTKKTLTKKPRFGLFVSRNLYKNPFITQTTQDYIE